MSSDAQRKTIRPYQLRGAKYALYADTKVLGIAVQTA